MRLQLLHQTCKTLYLPTFLESKAQDFYPGSARIFKYDATISEDFQRCPKIPEDILNNVYCKTQLCPQIREFGESIVIYSFCMDFSFLIFLESESDVIAHIFQPGARNWSVSMSWHEIEVFNPQA